MSTVIDVPPQTTGDGTSAGPLSVFARGWNGYLKTLREMHPNIQFREGCIDVSGPFQGDLSLREVNDRLRARVAELEQDTARLAHIKRGIRVSTDDPRRLLFDPIPYPDSTLDANAAIDAARKGAT